jgi:hypothetical protein
MSTVKYAALAAAALLVACGRGAAPPAQPQPLSIDERVFYDDDVGIRDSTTFAIRDRAALEQAWRQITEPRRTPPALDDVPELAGIDFRRDMLIVVAAGRMTRGDRVRIERVGRGQETDARGRQEEVLVVHFTIIEGCRTVPDAAYPLEIVRVPRYNGTVRYQGTRSQATDCR